MPQEEKQEPHLPTPPRLFAFLVRGKEWSEEEQREKAESPNRYAWAIISGAIGFLHDSRWIDRKEFMYEQIIQESKNLENPRYIKMTHDAIRESDLMPQIKAELDRALAQTQLQPPGRS